MNEPIKSTNEHINLIEEATAHRGYLIIPVEVKSKDETIGYQWRLINGDLLGGAVHDGSWYLLDDLEHVIEAARLWIDYHVYITEYSQ